MDFLSTKIYYSIAKSPFVRCMSNKQYGYEFLSVRRIHVIIEPSVKNKGGAILGRPSKYDNMSREELLAAMKERNKAYCWRKTCTLTVKEGEIFDNLLQQNNCPNISQFIKKICRGELTVLPAESNS